jgi:dihydrofolate reductase
MRRIIAFDHVSADGYFATGNGKLDWVVPDEELTRSNLRSMADADTILFGRRTYEMFESFWPNAIKDPRGAQDPHAEGRRSETIQKVGDWINNATKIVFSRTRKTVVAAIRCSPVTITPSPSAADRGTVVATTRWVAALVVENVVSPTRMK